MYIDSLDVSDICLSCLSRCSLCERFIMDHSCMFVRSPNFIFQCMHFCSFTRFSSYIVAPLFVINCRFLGFVCQSRAISWQRCLYVFQAPHSSARAIPFCQHLYQMSFSLWYFSLYNHCIFSLLFIHLMICYFMVCSFYFRSLCSLVFMIVKLWADFFVLVCSRRCAYHFMSFLWTSRQRK